MNRFTEILDRFTKILELLGGLFVTPFEYDYKKNLRRMLKIYLALIYILPGAIVIAIGFILIKPVWIGYSWVIIFLLFVDFVTLAVLMFMLHKTVFIDDIPQERHTISLSAIRRVLILHAFASLTFGVGLLLGSFLLEYPSVWVFLLIFGFWVPVLHNDFLKQSGPTEYSLNSPIKLQDIMPQIQIGRVIMLKGITSVLFLIFCALLMCKAFGILDAGWMAVYIPLAVLSAIWFAIGIFFLVAFKQGINIFKGE